MASKTIRHLIVKWAIRSIALLLLVMFLALLAAYLMTARLRMFIAHPILDFLI